MSVSDAKQLDDKSCQQLQILNALDDVFKTRPSISSLQLASATNRQHEKIVGIIKSLESRNKVNVSEAQEQTAWFITDEGKVYAEEGTPESRLFNIVKCAGKSMALAELKKDGGKISEAALDIGMKNGLKLKWLSMDKATKSLVCNVDDVVDVVHSILKSIGDQEHVEEELLRSIGEKEGLGQLHDLKKRKLADAKKIKYYEITKGSEFSTELKQVVTDLTQEMIISGSWKDVEFKPYNFFAAGLKPQRGSVHPLMRVVAKFKKILLSMQFEEMPTQAWVESSFWNFDTLYLPQQHPARDMQDTFFLKDPTSCNVKLIPEDYLQQVKTMHEEGGMGSTGWRYKWSSEETAKNILRTHTTASSSRMLYALAQEYQKTQRFTPKRYFSIDRVFRNETLDATHLAEFHQVEGLICDKGMNLADLMAVMKTFYTKIGISDLRFKPAYNPYTEPSMEIFGFHPLLGRWIEVGNSGVFRPEMLRPMGFPDDVSVIAWGLSVERPTMIRYGVRNIRELFGHKATLGVA